MLHQDNAPTHSSLLIRNILAMHETTFVPQPPDSPDLAPADFLLFTKQKFTLKDRRFEPVQYIQENLLAELPDIPQKALECFQNSFLKSRERCIRSELFRK
jgi:hypothetical protein